MEKVYQFYILHSRNSRHFSFDQENSNDPEVPEDEPGNYRTELVQRVKDSFILDYRFLDIRGVNPMHPSGC